MSMDLVFKTSEPGWVARLAEAYRAKRNVQLIDDANVGISPATDSLQTMGRGADSSWAWC
jgi:hypothetical protein